MRKFTMIVFLATPVVLGLSSCGNGNKQSQKQTDSAHNEVQIPAPDNNSATNPSLADTSFSKQSDTITRKDSSRH